MISTDDSKAVLFLPIVLTYKFQGGWLVSRRECDTLLFIHLGVGKSHDRIMLSGLRTLCCFLSHSFSKQEARRVGVILLAPGVFDGFGTRHS